MKATSPCSHYSNSKFRYSNTAELSKNTIAEESAFSCFGLFIISVRVEPFSSTKSWKIEDRKKNYFSGIEKPLDGRYRKFMSRSRIEPAALQIHGLDRNLSDRNFL